MGEMIDIRSKITNNLPVVQITEDIVVTINNRKSNILNMQAMINEREKKEIEGTEESSEVEYMDKALAMLIGDKNVTAVNEMDLPITEYKELFQTIMGVAMGTYGTPKKL